MGQQQLLLLVLGIVIVGIAVVAGIQAFSEGKQKAEQDAAVSDAMRIISDIQAWKLKPGAFGGGADLDAGTFGDGTTDVTFKAMGYPVVEATKYATYNGCYELNATGGGGALVTVYGDGVTELTDHDSDTNTPEIQATTCTAGTEIAEVSVNGVGTDDISWKYL